METTTQVKFPLKQSGTAGTAYGFGTKGTLSGQSEIFIEEGAARCGNGQYPIHLNEN